jgi:hypothetical protein
LAPFLEPKTTKTNQDYFQKRSKKAKTMNIFVFEIMLFVFVFTAVLAHEASQEEVGAANTCANLAQKSHLHAI